MNVDVWLCSVVDLLCMSRIANVSSKGREGSVYLPEWKGRSEIAFVVIRDYPTATSEIRDTVQLHIQYLRAFQ